jgi:predicted acyl esterase
MIKKTISPIFFWLFSFSVHLLAQNVSEATYTVTEEIDVMVPMRDGIRLATNIYRLEDRATVTHIILPNAGMLLSYRIPVEGVDLKAFSMRISMRPLMDMICSNG